MESRLEYEPFQRSTDLVGEELQAKLLRRKQISDRHVFIREGAPRYMASPHDETGPTESALEDPNSDARPSACLDSRTVEARCFAEAALVSVTSITQPQASRQGCWSVTTPSACSSHFSLSSPRLAVSTSETTSCTEGGISLTDLESVSDDEEDGPEEDVDMLQYEWQFEILNSLPHARAVALVNHLRRVERDRVKARRDTVQLRKANSDLRQKIAFTSAVAQDKGVLSGAAQHAEVTWEDEIIEDEPHDDDCAVAQQYCGRVAKASLKLLIVVVGIMMYSRSLKLAPESFGVNMLIPTCTPIEQSQLETLERLQLDVEDALQRGQSTVCWRV